MAGDWLKLDSSTPEKPEVLAITARMGWDDPDMTVGKLFRVWRWFDQHTTDGNAARVTTALLDRIAGVSGFAEAMKAEGWLAISEAGLSLPKFDRHNGATAKARAQTAKRVANHRAEGTSNAGGNADSVTDALAREEKRREEKKEEKAHVVAKAPDAYEPDGFKAFWVAWPSGGRKGGKSKCLELWKRKRFEVEATTILMHVAALKESQGWLKDGGQYVPAPISYLNNRSWDGADLCEQSTRSFAGAI